MEIACGEHGDVVPKLVVAAQNAASAKLQNPCVSEIKSINCDKSMKDPNIMDSKHSLQDSIHVDKLLPGYNELLSVEKLETSICADEVTNQFSSPWKTLDCSSSDTTSTSSKLVSTSFYSMIDFSYCFDAVGWVAGRACSL